MHFLVQKVFLHKGISIVFQTMLYIVYNIVGSKHTNKWPVKHKT